MKITLIAGSNRKDASSTKLLRYIAGRIRSQGHDARIVDLYETPLPFYTPDAESVHPNVAALLEAVRSADALAFATPEYHGSVSGVLKNALDFLDGDAVRGKPTLSVSASGGPVGVASLTQLQAIVRNLHGVNSPEWVSLGGGAQRFASDGSPADAGVRQRVERAVDTFLALASALGRSPERAGEGRGRA